LAGPLLLLELLLNEDLNPPEADPEFELALELPLLKEPPLPFMVHEALKVAPGSTANLVTATVPSITAEDFNESKSETKSSPLKLPSISAFTHSTLP
jgi:hypothetical protein